MSDSVTTCPVCGFTNCPVEPLEEENHESYLCTECGYTATTYNKKHSKVLKQLLDNSAQIIKDLKFFDEERLIYWFPAVINMPNLGILFPEGNEVEWQWVFAPVVQIPEEERQNWPVPGKDNEFYDSRLALEQAKKYSNDKFRDALNEMGAII